MWMLGGSTRVTLRLDIVLSFHYRSGNIMWTRLNSMLASVDFSKIKLLAIHDDDKNVIQVAKVLKEENKIQS